MVSRKSMSRPPPDAGLDVKPRNKIQRKMLHIKRKRAKDAARHAERHAFKKEEAKNPKLKADRLKRNIPLTIDRKRVWDDAGSDVEDGLGLSVDVERIKRRKQEEEDELNRPLDEDEKSSEGEEESDDDEDDDDVDSMLASSDEEDEGVDGDDDDDDDDDNNTKKSSGDTRGRRKSSLPSATERATSPSQSTKSTNLTAVPDTLAAKFPSLFNTEKPPSPKILITTSLNSTLHHEAELLTDLFPNSVYVRRSRHRFAHQFSIREISKFASNRNFTAVVILREDQKKPTGLDIVHLPTGPMFHFSMTNWVEGKRIPGHGNSTEHWPELILNNFRTPLGLLTAHLFRTLFPPQPDIEGRQVVTVLNSRDYLFFRRHRYVFREKRETEKAVVGADGKEMKGAEGIRAGMQELGPRFTLKLRRVDKGIQRASGQEWEWKGGMEKTRTKFQL
ncbi:Brix-domain-containing protein [Aspergillus sclerotioniger CBS 115572]|uniref:Brix-domain-containing protein n=1 Tax=Aspergillus sclerotioniger CBS 115572 TaxID=1450535 RepID=A0A317WJ72_9EURO|nr:Brix-domain-containing protein [Aspergillus sclerotioniger CBS 115572]PWY85691.1 Brix-domain-containing protein [Aspergillus sclerotioniger CBS 115572]